VDSKIHDVIVETFENIQPRGRPSSWSLMTLMLQGTVQNDLHRGRYPGRMTKKDIFDVCPSHETVKFGGISVNP